VLCGKIRDAGSCLYQVHERSDWASDTTSCTSVAFTLSPPPKVQTEEKSPKLAFEPRRDCREKPIDGRALYTLPAAITPEALFRPMKPLGVGTWSWGRGGHWADKTRTARRPVCLMF
jgi:hypothetical protein